MSKPKSERPNILLIMTDQQRFDSIGALGNPVIQTPALDRLVREGVSFTSAYCASPVCIASRCSLVLGQYPHETGCVANTPMPQDRTSLMELLHRSGYQTHGIGKMHFCPDLWKLWGFDARDTSEEGYADDDYTRFLAENGYAHIAAPHGVRSEYYYLPQPSQLPMPMHHTQWVGDRACEFLRRRDSCRPFFLWVSFIKPHPPFENPEPWMRLHRPVEMPPPFLPPGYEHLLNYWNRVQNRYKYRDQGTDLNLLRTTRAAYYAAISFIDCNVGRVLDLLEQEGELDNTLILYTSDHGELLGDYGSYGKRSFLDVAAKVPLLVRYPAAFEAGCRCDQPVSLVDVGPTFLSAAGLARRPEHSGVSLAETAAGEAEPDFVIGQLSEEEKGLYMLVTTDFKYVSSAADRAEWLFHRQPGTPESCNLAGHAAFDGVLKESRQRLIDRFREDGYPTPLEGDTWKLFPPPPEVPANPDAWLLYQDGRSVDDLFPPGYAARVRPAGGLPVRGI